VTTAASPLRLAVIGVGWAGSRQTESVRELASHKLEVVCLVDPDADFLATRSKELGVERICSDLHDVLCDPDIGRGDHLQPPPFSLCPGGGGGRSGQTRARGEADGDERGRGDADDRRRRRGPGLPVRCRERRVSAHRTVFARRGAQRSLDR
jgi:hypothetical protein